MLELIKQFYEKNIASAGASPAVATERAVQIATAALLVEMMRIDDTIAEVERRVLSESICQRFALSDEQAEAVIAMAEEQVRHATDDFQFTSLINQAFTLEQKIEVIELLWLVAFADGTLDKYEEYLARKVADLLYVPHNAFIAAKSRARRHS
jgi:uncharacterized tellurite resistance protein B-like protein